MKVTFWLSRNNSNMQEFSVLCVWGEYKILWSDGFQYNERYLTLGVKLRHPPMQSLCPRPPQTHTLLLCSPELPDSWLFSIYSVQLKVCSCPCTSRAVTALAALWWPNISAIFACRMCRIVPVLRRGVFFLDSDQHQAEDFPESSSSIFPQTDFRCCPWSSLPSCPACLGLWPLSASVSISGTLNWYFLAQSLQPLLCWLEQLPRDSQAGLELGIKFMLLESHWNAQPEDLPNTNILLKLWLKPCVPQVRCIQLFLVLLRRVLSGRDCPQLPGLHPPDPLYFEVNVKPNCAVISQNNCIYPSIHPFLNLDKYLITV